MSLEGLWWCWCSWNPGVNGWRSLRSRAANATVCEGINVHPILIRIDKPSAKIGPTHHGTHHRRGNPHGRFHALTSKAFIKFQFSNHLRQRANWKWFFSNYTISLFSFGAESQPGFGTRLFMCDTIAGLRSPLCFVNCCANGIRRTRWHFVRSSPAERRSMITFGISKDSAQHFAETITCCHLTKPLQPQEKFISLFNQFAIFFNTPRTCLMKLLTRFNRLHDGKIESQVGYIHER